MPCAVTNDGCKRDLQHIGLRFENYLHFGPQAGPDGRRRFDDPDHRAHCKGRGALVALSIDGKKRSGNLICDLPVPDGLFRREVFIEKGRSMLRRFQMNGQTLEQECVADRLLLTY